MLKLIVIIAYKKDNSNMVLTIKKISSLSKLISFTFLQSKFLQGLT